MWNLQSPTMLFTCGNCSTYAASWISLVARNSWYDFSVAPIWSSVVLSINLQAIGLRILAGLAPQGFASANPRHWYRYYTRTRTTATQLSQPLIIYHHNTRQHGSGCWLAELLTTGLRVLPPWRCEPPPLAPKSEQNTNQRSQNKSTYFFCSHFPT